MIRKYCTGFLFFFLFLYLLLCPQKSLTAVRAGLLLWYQNVLPVLFPFMILSGLFIRMHMADQLPDWFLYPIRRLFGCSRQGCLAILTGFLCGFPIGARVTCDLQHSHQISDEEAEYLYGFTNNVSPAFLASYLACGQLHMPSYRLYFIFCVLAAPMLYARITRPTPHALRSDSAMCKAEPRISFALIDDCIQEAVTSSVKLGAYITVFSLLGTIVTGFFPDGSTAAALLLGILEITGGTSALAVQPLPWLLKAPLLCAICAFGGLSAFAQTVSITSMDGRMAFRYLKSRVVITLLTTAISFGILLLRSILSLKG
jgi:sporulation integral membrane protein YlbJ